MIQNGVITLHKLRSKSNYAYFIQSIIVAYYYSGIYGSDRLFSARDLFSERRKRFFNQKSAEMMTELFGRQKTSITSHCHQQGSI